MLHNGFLDLQRNAPTYEVATWTSSEDIQSDKEDN